MFSFAYHYMPKKITIPDLETYFWQEHNKYLALFNKVKNENSYLVLHDFIISINEVIVGEFGCYKCGIIIPDINLDIFVYSEHTDFKPYRCDVQIHGKYIMCSCCDIYHDENNSSCYNCNKKKEYTFDFDDRPQLFLKFITIINNRYFYDHYLSNNEYIINQDKFEECVNHIKIILMFQKICLDRDVVGLQNLLKNEKFDPSVNNNQALNFFMYKYDEDDEEDTNQKTLTNIGKVLLSYKRIVDKIVENEDCDYYKEIISNDPELVVQVFNNNDVKYAKKLLTPEIYTKTIQWKTVMEKTLQDSNIPNDIIVHLINPYLFGFVKI